MMNDNPLILPMANTNPPVASHGISTNTDSTASIATNVDSVVRDTALNVLPKVSAIITNPPVASIGVASDKEPSNPTPAGTSFPWTLSVLVVAVVSFVVAIQKKQRKAHVLPAATKTDAASIPAGSIVGVANSESGAIADDVLAAVAPDAPDRASLRTMLIAAIMDGTAPSDARLASILRIDESFEKRPGLKYLRRVSVLRRKDGSSGSLSKIESEIGWEYVPDSVRSEFIRTRGDKVVRRVYDAGKAERK